MTSCTNSTRPVWLRPTAAALVPPRQPACVQPGGQLAAPPPRYPMRGVQRVVVLSNVTRGFPWAAVGLRAGDLVVHCNRASNRAEAMAVPGTRHWLFVRHGKGRDERGWHWYHPRTFDGFERVIFVDDEGLREYKWYAEWHEAGRKSPTTGFIAANIVRELAPEMPLLLAGFEPGVHHGTYLWQGHDWEAERRWYAERGFCCIPPGSPRLLLLVCSCVGNTALRKACRDTWLSQLPPGVEYRFFVGADAPLPDEPDVLCLPGVADTYIGLPEKVMAAIGYANRHMEFDFLGKVDDDTYLRADRLLPLLVPGVHLLGRSRGGRRCPGGAGYFMSREAAGKLVEHAGDIPPEGDEDALITKKLVALGYAITDCYQLKQGRSEGMPEDGNDIISGHQLKSPELHYKCHKFNNHDAKQK